MSEKACIIIPCFNEEEVIQKVVDEARDCNPETLLIVVNDCSTDQTSQAAKKCKDTIVIDLPCNLGVGGAVQTGLMFAKDNNYDFAIKLDGDGQHDPNDVQKMLETLKENKADIVIGSRFISDVEGYKSSFFRRFGIGFLEILCKLLTGKKITDPTSGFRAYNKIAISFMAEHYPSFDYPEPEELILASKNQFRVLEIPTSMRARITGVSSISSAVSVYYMLKVSLSMLFIFLRKPERNKGF